MPIRKRLFTSEPNIQNIPIRTETGRQIREAFLSSDNVTMHDERADDHRGVFDPKDDPFPGSKLDTLSHGDRENAGAVVRHIAYTQPETVEYPKEMRVQDLLAQVRTTYNGRDSVEISYRKRVRSPLTAIRAFCVVECRAGSPKAVSKCDVMECPFWTLRMGKNGMRGRA